MKWTRKLVPITASIGVVAASNLAIAAPFQDQLVQPPSIGQPARGSIAGSLSRLAFGPSSLSRGTYAIPLPVETPSERGAILAEVVPSYSAESGVGEWGVGWQSDLTIRRHRVIGEIDFSDDDQFVSPWGPLVRGDDGAFYPAGLRSMVRLSFAGDGWEALTGDGTVYRFDEADASVTADGTYSWNLSRVDSILGDSTTLTWTRNTSGRAFLSQVLWGGRGDGTQYRMQLDYQALATPFETFYSGEKAVLDRRVSRVTTSVWEGGYVERWRHDLTYQASPTGPAFYLASVTKRYASGATEPPVTYTYDFSTDQLANATFQSSPELGEVLTTYGAGAIQPDRAAMTDLERNGLTDMEVHLDNTLVRQTEDGYVFEPLPAPTGAENALCRPAPAATNKPRFLARMHGDAEQPNVVVTRQNPLGTSTRIVVCDRAGMTTYDQSLSGAWGVGPNVRLADVDRDQKPDLVRVGFGTVQVLSNTSTSPEVISFTPGATTSILPRVTPVASWLLDFNGDYRADLMVRHSGGVVVWRGVGGGKFEPTGTTFNFVTAGGLPLSGLSTYEISHGDFNNDDLSDVILTKGQAVLLFTNRGNRFVQTPVAAFASIPWTVSYPVVADLSGTGNEQIVMANGTDARVLQLSRASTGLLVTADDGKGTAIHLDYGRVRPAPGVTHLYSILGSMSVASSGYDEVTYDYDYGAPVWHSQGKYLVGFEEAHKASPFLEETVAFFNDDDIAGAVTATRGVDARTPDVTTFSDRETELATFHGVPWLRLVSETSGYQNDDGSARASSRVDYLAHSANGTCPTVIETVGPEGTHRQETTFVEVPGLDPELTCLSGSLRLVGTHADATLDYDYRVDLTRDDIGRLVRADQVGPSGATVLQQIVYGADDRIASIASPGKGATLFAYDARGQLSEVTAPDGVVTTVEARAAGSDAIVHDRIDRGGVGWDRFYAYDGMERLAASWDSHNGGSAAEPLSAIEYTFATLGAPGRILQKNLIDADTGDVSEVADLLAADGEKLAIASRQPAGWTIGNLTSQSRSLRTSHGYVRDPIASLTGLDLAALYAGASEISTITSSGRGDAVASEAAVQDGVVREGATTRAISGGQLVATGVENGTFSTVSGFGADGKARFYQDQSGVQSFYRYDAMGRLRRVIGPSGTHAIDYDALGRPSRVARAGLQSIEYAYDDVTNLLAVRRERDRNGALDRTESYTYDAIGRPQTTTMTKAATGETRTVTQRWDGALPGRPTVPGQAGRLSGVSVGGVVKETIYAPDGKLTSARIDLDGWRTVDQTTTYLASGLVSTVATTIVDDQGNTVLESEKAFAYDTYGRVAALSIDGTEVASVSYDALGRTSVLHFADGDLTFQFDPLTRAPRGYASSGGIVGGVSWDKNERDLTARETVTAGGETVARDYTYDARRFLVGSDDASGETAYAYDAAGLVSNAEDQAGERAIVRAPGTITAGGETYVLDAMGRVIQRGDLAVTYGPSGHLEHATRSGDTYAFAYDESGNRVLKYEDGVPVAGYVAGGFLGSDGFVEGITIQGVLVGVVENGVFRRVLFDRRGTALTDDDGDLDLASPYGVRLSHGDLAEAIDYVKKGFDPDLGLVRMGVRDYDPELSQFWSPDPLFMAEIDRCAASPSECNLYGYAGNDPIGFVDPTGTEKKKKEAQSSSNDDDAWFKLPEEGGVGATGKLEVVSVSVDTEAGPKGKNPIIHRSADRFGGADAAHHTYVPSANRKGTIPHNASVTITTVHVARTPYTLDFGVYSEAGAITTIVETKVHFLVKNGEANIPTFEYQKVSHFLNLKDGRAKIGEPSDTFAQSARSMKNLETLVDMNKVGVVSWRATSDKETGTVSLTVGLSPSPLTVSDVPSNVGFERGGVSYTPGSQSVTRAAQSSLRERTWSVNLTPKAGVFK